MDTTQPTAPESKPQPTLEPEAFTTRLQVGVSMWPSLVAFGIILALVLGAALFLTGYWALRPAPNSLEGRKLALQKMAATNAAIAQSADSAANQVEWNTAKQKLLAAQRFHGEIRDRQPRVEADLKRLLSSADGKRIASREAWVDQFMAIQDTTRLTQDELDAQLRAVQSLLPTCEQALKDKVIIPCDERFRNQVDNVHKVLAEAKQQLEAQEQGLATVVAMTKAAPPGGNTLETAVTERKTANQAEALAKLTTERGRQRRALEDSAREQQLAVEKELEETKLAAEQKVREAELAQKKAEDALRVLQAEAKSKDADQNLKQAQGKHEQERIKAERVAKFEAEFPKMKSLLSPFISSGKLQYVAASKAWREAEPGPLSLSAIESTGALKDNTHWYVLLHLLVPINGGVGNDRPPGSFPTTMDRGEIEVRRAAKFLRDYGDILVERKLMLP